MQEESEQFYKGRFTRRKNPQQYDFKLHGVECLGLVGFFFSPFNGSSDIYDI